MTANARLMPEPCGPHGGRRPAMAAGAALVLLLGAGCGARPAHRAGAGKAAAGTAAAPAISADVALMTAAASRTLSPVDSASEAPEHLRALGQPARTAEGCEAHVYELILAVTSSEGAGSARRVCCLVLDLGDLSIRTVEKDPSDGDR